MTPRDPRSRPSQPLLGGGREPTQSLSLPPEDEPHPSLAVGTHEAGHIDDPTRIDSPQARSRTPAPPKPAQPPPIPRDDPEGRIGTTLGNYRVTDLLGKGGMGCVYRAEHTKLGREVALKMLRSDYAKRRDAVSRFMQEARTVNRIRHRNIVDVPDILELEDGTTCIVMELLTGQSLGKWARTGIELPRAIAIIVQICDGLAAAHAVGVVHRDLKPDNVIVVKTSDGAEQVKLLDFGVAKLLNRDDEDVGFQTAAGSVIGTPAYMSPEQAGGMTVDARSDIYSLGAIMYELFCGEPMFRGRSFGEYVRKHLTEQPVPPRKTQAAANLDERIEAVILKAIEKEPDRRYPTALAMREELLQLLGTLETRPPVSFNATSSGQYAPPLPAVPPTPAMAAIPVMPAMPFAPPTTGQTSSPPRRPMPVWAWFAGGAAVVTIGIAAAVLSTDDETTPSTPPPSVTAMPAPDEPPPVARPLPVVAVAPPPKLVELHFDSLPSGGVYADGRSSELCRTPCTFNVDLSDGESTERRTFIVRNAGYKDARVEVDLTAPKPLYGATLEPLAAVTRPVPPPPPAKAEKPRSKKPRSSVKRPSQPTTPPPSEEPKDTSGGKIDRSYTRDPFKSDR